ncbi:hypothetical protein [Ferrovum sp.]|uniref:ATP-dependent DNA ligase n=1 Tax=Ferrovum sp. TaxID=2609467 RepID=UPI002639C377|nr:hypothetical protein [Ferrovum sp.]
MKSDTDTVLRMMASDTIFDCIEAIASTSSKNEKEVIIKKVAINDEFQRVLEYAYNPFKTYGIAKRPEVRGHGHLQFDSSTWELLDDLSNRVSTGNAAIEKVRFEMEHLSKPSAELFWRIIKKDLRAGFSESTINKAVKGLIPTFPYMRCCLPKDAKLSAFDWEKGVISQEKADGMFANVDIHANRDVSIRTRQGSEFPSGSLSALEVEVARLLAPNYQHHGELLVLVDGVVQAREIGNGMLNSVLQGGDLPPGAEVIFKAWDLIPIADVKPKGKGVSPYSSRLQHLEVLARGSKLVSLIETRIVHSMEEANYHYRELVKQGKEGTVIKDPHGTWKDGTSKFQVKLKLEVDVDLEVVDFVPGEGKNASTFGSVLCRTADGELEVAVSGFTDAMRLEIHANRQRVLGKIMTVRANSIMTPSESNNIHSLFLPRFVELREDKTHADTLHQVKKQFAEAVKTA